MNMAPSKTTGSMGKYSAICLLILVVSSSIQLSDSFWPNQMDEIKQQMKVIQQMIVSLSEQIETKCTLLKNAAQNRQMPPPVGPGPMPPQTQFSSPAPLRPDMSKPPPNLGPTIQQQQQQQPGPMTNSSLVAPTKGPGGPAGPVAPIMGSPTLGPPVNDPTKFCPKVDCYVRLCDLKNPNDSDCFKYFRSIRRSHLIEPDYDSYKNHHKLESKNIDYENSDSDSDSEVDDSKPKKNSKEEADEDSDSD